MSQTTYYDLIRRVLLTDAAANAPPEGVGKEIKRRLDRKSVV